jgi:cathepsin L
MTTCAPNPDDCGGTGGCAGSTAELAFDYVVTAGMYQEYQLGYSPIVYNGTTLPCTAGDGTPVATIGGYVQLPSNNYTALMNAVSTVGPIAVSVAASSWFSYTSGVFSLPLGRSPDINHLVVLMGYGVDSETGQPYWLVRNSWSPLWYVSHSVIYLLTSFYLILFLPLLK